MAKAVLETSGAEHLVELVRALKWYAEGNHIGEPIDVGSCGVASTCIDDSEVVARKALSELPPELRGK
jgi:hypothetical protein